MPRFREDVKKYNFEDTYKEFFDISNKTNVDGNVYALVPVVFDIKRVNSEAKPELVISRFEPCFGKDAEDAYDKSVAYLKAIFKNIGKDKESVEIKKALQNVRDVSSNTLFSVLLDNKNLRFYMLSKENRQKTFIDTVLDILSGHKRSGKDDVEKLYLDRLEDLKRIAWDKIAPGGVNMYIENSLENEKRIDDISREDARIRHPLSEKEQVKEETKVEELLMFRKPGTMDHVIGDSATVKEAINGYKKKGWTNEDLDVATVSKVKEKGKKDYIPTTVTKTPKTSKGKKTRVREKSNKVRER